MMSSGDYYMDMCHGERIKKYLRDFYQEHNEDNGFPKYEAQRRLVLNWVGPKRDYLKKSKSQVVESPSKKIKKDYEAIREDLKKFKKDRKAQIIKNSQQ